jgi:allophanate hydrolase
MTHAVEFNLAYKFEDMKVTAKTRPLFSIRELAEGYAQGNLTPTRCIDDVLQRIEAIDRPEVWTARVATEVLRARAAELEELRRTIGPEIFVKMPLYGVPFAVKDNIDVAGMPTTAACSEFAYMPQASAFAAQRLLDAGAILIGKTNLDQFATGLVGVRSPYGAVRQVDFPEHISGGSSSGSAVAVAAGIVAFSLGTDTAGSGRVPAGFNELVGLKPSLGLVSKRGVLPACRTLDTVSVFARDVGDAWRVLREIACFDALDPWSRTIPQAGLLSSQPRVGVPDQLEFFDDCAARQAFHEALNLLSSRLHVVSQPVDFAPLKQASALLYDGPWIAERRAALGAFFETNHDALDPVVAAVIAKADNYSAVDAFNAQYRLAELKREAQALFADIDVLIVPTTPTHPTIAAVRANPVELNSQLGYYTNFVNLLDLCALAVPCVRRSDGLPAGITLIAPAGADHRLAALGAQIQALFFDDAAVSDSSLRPLLSDEPSITLAVVGAHLRGQPLNPQLLEVGAHFLEATHTSADYRLFALADTKPPKPALVYVPEQGGDSAAPTHAIVVELWQVPLTQFGQLVAQVPAPLGIGTVRLADGRSVKGFICEPSAITSAASARDITHFGGWLAYLASLAESNSAAVSP